MFIQNALVASAGEGSGSSPSSDYDITNLDVTATNDRGLLSLIDASANTNNSPTGHYLSHDGLSYFVADQFDVAIYKYTLSTAFDVGTGTLAQTKTLWSSNTNGYLGDIYFKSNGRELYVTNYFSSASSSVNGQQSIFRYTLSAAWDLSTATLTTTTVADFYLLGPLTTISLSPTGDKLFLGTGHDTGINHAASFSLSTAWDISTTSLGTTTPVRNLSGLNTIGDGVTFKGIANLTGTSNPGTTFDVLFNSTGTTAWFLTNTDKTIRQYTLGTAYDLKTLSYANKSLSVSSQNSAPRGIAWGDSGSKFYMVGLTGDKLYQYSASVSYDLGTVTYSNKQLDVNTLTGGALTSPYKVNWKPDGTRFFIICSSTERIYQFDIPAANAWDITYATFTTGDYKDLNPPYPFATYGFDIDPNGLFFIVGGYSNYRISKWSMSTAWDVTTAGSYSTTDRYDWASPSFSSSTADAILCVHRFVYAYTVRFIDSGSKLFLAISGKANSIVNLSTSYDLSTASWTSPSSNYLVTRGLYYTATLGNFAFSESGTNAGKRFVYIDPSINKLRVVSLSTAWNLSSALTTSDPLNTVVAHGPKHITASAGATNNGEYYYTTDGNGVMSCQFEVTTPWTNLPTDYSAVRPSSNWARPSLSKVWDDRTFKFGNDGQYLYTIDNQNDTVRYTLNTAYDLTTIDPTTIRTSLFRFQDTSPSDFAFSSDGKKLYMVGRSTDTVYQYSLTIAWDHSTASYTNKSCYVGSQENNPYAITFDPDGNYLFVGGTQQDEIFKYSLTIAWDISTASYANNSLDVGESTLYAIAFNPIGTRVIAGGGNSANASAYAKQWNLSAAWDLSTASLNADHKPLLPPNCFNWNDDGTKLFIGTGYPYSYMLGKAEIWEYDASP